MEKEFKDSLYESKFNYYRVLNMRQSVIDLFKNNGYKVVCADIKNSVSVYDADLKKPILLIVGGEKRGISGSLRRQKRKTPRPFTAAQGLLPL